ncbi:hypothetical protein Axy23_015 [Achromobacter phage vB_AxyP_19-32_Axy23]|uniref:Uncharacterized protein n=1 Tax=Achromobacter phage vB_AxyP_19-32_Axy23 TaxID=2591047 RepID=A0A514CW28_9CAUD|nr:hypothetical protein Axy23_015 [Achromobacter phage vB_AxyP_19-32_Axy23]
MQNTAPTFDAASLRAQGIDETIIAAMLAQQNARPASAVDASGQPVLAGGAPAPAPVVAPPPAVDPVAVAIAAQQAGQPVVVSGGTAPVAAQPDATAAPTAVAAAAPVAQPTPAPEAAPKPELTQREKLEAALASAEAGLVKAQERVEKARQNLDALTIVDRIQVGVLVEFEFGRASTKRLILGRVHAAEDGVYAIFHGEGVQASITTVPLSAIKRIVEEA